MSKITIFLLLDLILLCKALAPLSSLFNRRDALSKVTQTISFSILSSPSNAAPIVESNKSTNSPIITTTTTLSIDYHNRDRIKNKKAVIREDIWYMTGKIPPQSLNPNFIADEGPQYNAWGLCTTSTSTGNSCTYVPLKQRIPGYSTYAFNIALGAREYTQLGTLLRDIQNKSNANESQLWDKVMEYVMPSSSSSVPPPAMDALLKMVLIGTAMLTTPNYTGPPKELLVARFYVNEVSFALSEISEASKLRDIQRAIAAWEFGRDSWNSYFVLINRSIVPKVGEPFEMIAA